MTFFGDGHGKLRNRTTYKMKGAPFGIAAADLNGDHYPDLVATGVLNGSVAVFMNDGTGKFLKPVTYDGGGGEVVDVKVADLRHDGNEDLVVANLSRGAVAVLLNNGDGTFGTVKLYTTCPYCQGPDALAVADFNLDGKLDIAAASQAGDSAFCMA